MVSHLWFPADTSEQINNNSCVCRTTRLEILTGTFRIVWQKWSQAERDAGTRAPSQVTPVYTGSILGLSLAAPSLQNPHCSALTLTSPPQNVLERLPAPACKHGGAVMRHVRCFVSAGGAGWFHDDSRCSRRGC